MKRFLDFLNGMAIVFTATPVLEVFLKEHYSKAIPVIFFLGWFLELMVILIDRKTKRS